MFFAVLTALKLINNSYLWNLF